MPVLYKDFNKDVKDLLTKNFNDGKWKLESKFKGPDSTLYVNPNVEDGKLSADLQYDVKEYGLKGKVSVSQDLSLKDKVTYEGHGHKLEVTFSGFGCCCSKEGNCNLNTESLYEYKTGPLAIDAKTVCGSGKGATVDAGLAFEATPQFTAGAGAKFVSDKGLSGWSAGVRYAADKRIASVTYASNGTALVGVLTPFVCPITQTHFNIAAQYEHAPKPSATAGAEFTCPFTGATVKVKGNNLGVLGLSLTKKFADNWKASVSYEHGGSNKVGLLVSRE